VISGGKHLDGKEWIEREERRRTWWSSWELDNFASTVSGRPYGHDKGQLQVLLPVSDEAWFSNTPIASAPLHTDTLKVWKSLEICQNQDERAWFLLSIYLVRLTFDISRSPGYPQTPKDIKTAIDCFALVLPRKFDLSNGGLLFDQRNWRNSCWIIGTNLMVQGYVQFLFHFLSMLLVTDAWKFIRAHTMIAKAGHKIQHSTVSDESLFYQTRPSTLNMLHAIQTWAPEYMPFSPYMACTLLGPHGSHIENILVQRGLSGPQSEHDPLDLDIDLLKLCLKRHSCYWDIGTFLLGISLSSQYYLLTL
jgi:hypothetical protein